MGVERLSKTVIIKSIVSRLFIGDCSIMSFVFSIQF